MKINYVSSFNRGEITAEAKIIDRVRETVVGDVTIIDEDGRLVAKSMGTYIILKNNAIDT
jgi:acyl-coenzyme A thioesterase PaaI-like protein